MTEKIDIDTDSYPFPIPRTEPLEIEKTEERTWPYELFYRKQWMFTKEGEKFPYSAINNNPHTYRKWSMEKNYSDLIPVLHGVHKYPEIVDHPAIILIGEGKQEYTTDVPGDLIAIDIDDGIVNNEIDPRALSFLSYVFESMPYIELSQSGEGLHAIGIGEIPTNDKQYDFNFPPLEQYTDTSVEIYDGGHIIKTTGEKLKYTPNELIKTKDERLREIIEYYRPKKEEEPSAIPDDYDEVSHEPELSRNELSKIEKTWDWNDIFDARAHLTHRDVNLRSYYKGMEDNHKESWYPAYRSTNSGISLKRDKRTGKWWDMKKKSDNGFDVLSVLAADYGIIHRPYHDLSGDDFKKALQIAREQGANIPKHVSEPVDDFLIYENRFNLDHLKQNSIKQNEIYERSRKLITSSMERGDRVVFDALMGTGKTYNAIGAINDLEEQGLYVAPRRELYSQAQDYALQNGYDNDEIYMLPSLFSDCSSMPNSGEEPENQREEVALLLFEMGVMPAKIHKYLFDNFEMDCCHAEEDECKYKIKTKEEKEGYKLLIGHYNHAYIPEYTKQRHVIVDEDPHSTFTTRVGGDLLIQSVNNFCSSHAQFEFDGWNDLLHGRNDDDRCEQALAYLHKKFDLNQRDEKGAITLTTLNNGPYHSLTPQAILLIMSAEEIGDGSAFERSGMEAIAGNSVDQVLEFMNEESASIDSGVFFTTSESHGGYYAELNATPNLDYAKSVSCLDGTPFINPETGSPDEWENALGESLNVQRILSDEERRSYIRNELGHKIYQSTEHVKPYSSGKYNNPEYDQALVSMVHERTGVQPMLFSSKKVVEEYSDWWFVDDSDYWGNLKGSNEYGKKRAAVLLGSAHHGDHELRRRASHLAVELQPDGKGVDRTYGNETGDALFEHMTEATTAQTAMRVGRDGEGATIVIDTCMIPDYMPVQAELDVTPRLGVEEEIREFWNDEYKVSPKAVLAGIESDVTIHHVRHCLNTFVEQGLVTKEEDQSDGRRFVYSDNGLSDVEAHTPKEVVGPDIERIMVFTSNLRISPSETAPNHVLDDSQGEVPVSGGDETRHDT